uniref:Secreted protein n=1 Tax=Amblyomma cajennense TaxID=34607 RepID=A0A023FCS8_AMBCJ
MRSLIFLTLLALISSTLALVVQVNTRNGTKYIHLNETFFDALPEECPNNETENCSYRTACYCLPPPSGYLRLGGYIYSPEHNKCFEYRNLDHGCNSFRKKQDCIKECVYGKRPRPPKALRIKKN